MTMDRRSVVVGLSTVVALGAAACGRSPTAASGDGGGAPPGGAEKVFAELGALTGPERRDKILKVAKAEGALSLYTSMTSEVAKVVVDGFTAAFAIPVSLYRSGSETVLQRILQEKGAGYQGADVVETNAYELFALNREGVLAEFKGPRRDLVPEAGRFEGWTATRFNLFAPSWNTRLVSSEDRPKTWEDLADPKWQGRLSLEVSDDDWFLTLYKYWEKQGKTVQQIDDLFARMVKGAKIAKGHTLQAELLSAGQFAVVASDYTYIIQRAKDKGAPVDYRPFVEPVIARPNGIGLVKNAKHPAAAMLFVDWLLEEGQALLEKEDLTPAIASLNDPLKGVEIIPIDVKTLVEDGPAWSKRYEALVSKGLQVSK